MTSFLFRDYDILPKKELLLSLRVDKKQSVWVSASVGDATSASHDVSCEIARRCTASLPRLQLIFAGTGVPV